MSNIVKTQPDSSRKLTRLRRQRGASSVEYIIVLLFIAITGIAVYKQFSTKFKTAVGEANTKFGDVKAQ